MRIPLATDIKTRTGAPDKDARIKNAYVETRGDQSVVRKRPIAQGGISVATVGSIAQGGIAYTTSSGGNGVFFLYGDAQGSYSGDGTTWSAATNYSVGDHVTYNWEDYWALTDNINQNPTTNPDDWSTEPVPKVPFAGTYATLVLGTANLQGNYSDITKNSGKWYWEVTITANDTASDLHKIGVFGPLLNMTGIAWTWDTYPSGFTYSVLNGSSSIPSPRPAVPIIGETLGVAWDAGGATISVRFPDGNTVTVSYGSPYTLRAQFDVMLAANGTVNFGSSPFVYSVPSGYNSGLYTL